METVKNYDEVHKWFFLFYLRFGGREEIAPDTTFYEHPHPHTHTPTHKPWRLTWYPTDYSPRYPCSWDPVRNTTPPRGIRTPCLSPILFSEVSLNKWSFTQLILLKWSFTQLILLIYHIPPPRTPCLPPIFFVCEEVCFRETINGIRVRVRVCVCVI